MKTQPFKNNSRFNVKHELDEKCKIWFVSRRN